MLENKIILELQKIPRWKQKKYLLAFSGGIDSVVLAILFKKKSLNFSIAHCNFKLRGKESDQDQAFVENFSEKHQIPVFIRVCDLSNTNENTQLAARKSRYLWFDELLKKHHFDYLITAHHLNDSIETFFINLLRGTGLKGLTGINNSQKILRPLRNITREEIKNFALENQLKWREDSSNASDKYLRNHIRHFLIPELKKTHPKIENSFLKTFSYLQQSQSVINNWFAHHKQNLIKKETSSEKLLIDKWKNLKEKNLFLYEWLFPYGFSDWKAINHLPYSQTGKSLTTKKYRLSKHQNHLILEPLPKKETPIYPIHLELKKINQPIELYWNILNRSDIDDKTYKQAGNDEAYIDFDLLKEPLIIKKWEKGDYFYPIGMKGKKKLSDFFKDEKMSKSEKEKKWLFCSQKNIVWIIGKRIDERYKITKKTTHILHIKIKKEIV